MKTNRSSSLELARRLRAGGVDIDVPEDDPQVSSVSLPDVLIRQTGGIIENTAYDYHSVTAYMLFLTITVNVGLFAISSFGLEVPWDDETIRFLEDPRELDGSEVYRLWAGGGPIEFHRDQVINHYADVRHMIPRGKSITGFLLGMGMAEIPEEYKHGTSIPAMLTIFDQNGQEYPSPVSLWADRSAPRRRAAPKCKPIFEMHDAVTRRR